MASKITPAASPASVISTEAHHSNLVISTEANHSNLVISTEAQRSGEIAALTNAHLRLESNSAPENSECRDLSTTAAKAQPPVEMTEGAAPGCSIFSISRRHFLTTLAAASLTPKAFAEPPIHTPRFTVLSLFHPQRLILHADTEPLPLLLNNQPTNLPRGDSLTIDAPTPTLKILTPATFAVEVPNKLRRTYRGTLTIDNADAHLRCVVGIERELAVASIVAAESPPHATPHALAAQAVAARSFLVGATTSHVDADFCDTTHCQFLREPPLPESPFTKATQRTTGLVLQYRSSADDSTHTLAAMYSRSCGGRTRTLAELGLPARNYPYYAVDCAFCRAHPELWQRNIDTQQRNNERARLDYNRIHGWSALPGHIDNATALHIEGRGVGHGLGLCQLGAAAMAAHGATFAEILTHYYPNTALAHVT
jgi:stage II sporulation protein D